MALTTRQNAAAPAASLGRDFDFWTLVSVTTEADLGATAVLNRVVEVISLNGQPVLMGAVTGTTNKTLKFATEHTGAWTAATLKAALIADGAIPTVANFANCTVTLSADL